jgi:hypothetical protein
MVPSVAKAVDEVLFVTEDGAKLVFEGQPGTYK